MVHAVYKLIGLECKFKKYVDVIEPCEVRIGEIFVKVLFIYLHFFFAILWTELKAKSINLLKMNETNVSQYGPSKLVQ